jgi:hypothetical protein
MKTFIKQVSKFGVEVEFLSPTYSQSDLISALRAVDVPVTGSHYGSADTSVYKLQQDSSCGLELVSPPLQTNTPDDITTFKKAIAVLNAAGCRVNKSCGLHVHHDASGVTTKQLSSLVKYYAKFEEVLDSVQPISRRGNNNYYCRSILSTPYGGARTVEQVFEKVEAANTGYALAQAVKNDRYCKLNLYSLPEHNTVEFRQHAGTLDYEKIMNWVSLTNGLLWSAENSTPNGVGGANKWGNFWYQLPYGEERTELMGYYRKRVKELQGAA